MSQPITGAESRDEKNVARLGPRQVPIPDDWEAVPFEDAIELNPSYDKPDEGLFDFLPMDAVDEEMQTVEYWNKRERNDCTGTWFKNGDTVYAKITPCTENGKIAFINDLNTEVGSGSTEFLVFHPREGVTDEKFAYYLANLPEFRAVTISLMEGSTGRQRVPSDVFSGGLEVPLPPLPEQRRIADVLSTVDEQIQEAAEAADEMENLKRGLMQNFFRPDVSGGVKSSLGEVPSNWEVGQIREFGPEFVAGGTPSRSNEAYFEGEIPWLKTGAVQNSRVNESEEFLTEEGLENSTAKLVPSGSVLVAMYGGGTVGNVGLLEFDATTNQACCAIITEGSELNNEFLYYQLLFEHRRLVSYAAGASQQNLSKHDVEQFDIVVPPMEEQKRIASILSTVEKRASQERTVKSDCQELKRGLMQDLLTGKRRL